MFANNRLTKEQAYEKIKQYCSYQERCHREVKEKLYSFKLFKSEVEELIGNLIENNYLNEERFAHQFAGGKFRMKYWGRKKIEYELRQKGVSSYLIKSALKEIPEKDYNDRLTKLAETKWKSLVKEHYLIRPKKVINYLIQKGYEPVLATWVVSQIQAKAKP